MLRLQISNVGKINQTLFKSDRKRMQKEQELEKQTMHNIDRATANYDCDDIDIAFNSKATRGDIINSISTKQLDTKMKDILVNQSDSIHF